MTFEKAKQKALEFINANYSVSDDELVILDEETIEKKYGWYFFSASKKFLETENLSDMVLGNGPVLVEKSGNIIQLGTAYPVEYYIDEYEKK